ncbi:hypothetical protein NUH16_003220 [Penicillium rubens]|nr:hypothetical protein NUH16_003220 [Penicillium rubens]
MAAWLDVVADDAGWSLFDTDRLEDTMQGMSNPKTQYPFWIHFAGNANRIKALRALFPRNNVTRKGPAGLVQLHLSTTTAHISNPIVFSESEVLTKNSPDNTRWPTHLAEKRRKYHLPDGDSSSAALEKHQQDVIRQMVLPWTQILCLFVNTESELRAAQRLLQEPRPKMGVGDDVISNDMHIIVVQAACTHHDNHDKHEERHPLLKTGANIEVLDIRHRSDLSDAVAFEPLRCLLLDRIHDIRVKHISSCPPFSAYHLQRLWRQSIQHYVQRFGSSIFDCLSVARRTFPSNSSLGDHLMEFVRYALSGTSLDRDIYEFVASALLMDAYPPGMHSELHSPRL